MTHQLRGPLIVATAALGVGTALLMVGSSLWIPGGEDLLKPSRWTEGRDLEHTVAALVRCVALVLSGYLVLIAVLTAATATRPQRTGSRLAALITPPIVRRALVPGSVRIGLALSAVGQPSPAHAFVPLPDSSHAASTEIEAPTDLDEAEVVTMTVAETARLVRTGLPPTVEPADDQFWTVVPGDHLWLIATETLVDLLERQPTEREVTSYWRDLIERNRDNLVDASNPDLILPGQRFVLPRTVRRLVPGGS